MPAPNLCGWEDERLIAGIGTDIIEIARVEKAAGPAFIKRVYTEKEQSYCEARGAGKFASYAARWAGKEAVMKAFGTGLRGGSLLDIEILPDELGCPRVTLVGCFKELAEKKGITNIWISLSHAKAYAVAECVMEK